MIVKAFQRAHNKVTFPFFILQLWWACASPLLLFKRCSADISDQSEICRILIFGPSTIYTRRGMAGAGTSRIREGMSPKRLMAGQSLTFSAQALSYFRGNRILSSHLSPVTNATLTVRSSQRLAPHKPRSFTSSSPCGPYSERDASENLLRSFSALVVASISSRGIMSCIL